MNDYSNYVNELHPGGDSGKTTVLVASVCFVARLREVIMKVSQQVGNGCAIMTSVKKDHWAKTRCEGLVTPPRERE